MGDVGGNGDSIALWLAILMLGLSSVLGGLFYQHVLRRMRLRKELKDVSNAQSSIRSH